MIEQVTDVYFVPGMAASTSIFEYIKLPEDQFRVHVIPWKMPKPKEHISDYAKRMCEDIKHDNPVLIGVSFGGVMVQEMSKHVKLKKLIIISSVKSKHELPNRMKIARKTRSYKLLPTSIVSKIDNWERFAFGDFAKKRAEMYKRYLSVRDKGYLDWAIENMVCWDQEEAPEGIVHIHGDKDIVFPEVNINSYIKLAGGTHVMIVNRARWFNENLPKIIRGK
ncbi:alpha/beta hydrolase family protein [Aquimarina rhabdastrellae]